MRFTMPITSKGAERSAFRSEPRKATATPSCSVTGGGTAYGINPQGGGHEPV